MVVDYYLRIDGVQGESTEKDHAGWIELYSYAWGAQVTTNAGAGGAATGRATVDAVVVTFRLGRMSPQLFNLVVNGRRAQSATLHGVRTRDRPQKVVELEMANVTVTSYDSSAAAGDGATDSIALRFGSVTYSFWPQNEDGTVGAAVVAAWDARAR